MRIGIVASPWIPVPPPAYGGTETVVNNLCTGLAARGHDVHLVTVGDSTCPVTRSSVFDTPPTGMGEPIVEIVHVRAAYALLEGSDVIHDHTTIGPQFLADTMPSDVPVVTTLHGPFTPQTRLMYATRPERLHLIAISHAQRAGAPEIDVDAVIHHGIDLDLHRAGPGGGGYLMNIGRMSPDKGPDRAIRVARSAGMPLVLVSKMREPAEIAYFHEFVEPLLGPDITFVGEADSEQRLELLRHAEALVNPIQWPEPFGLVMAEALACGTPVIALRHGAAPEIVTDGSTGFLCDDLDEMVAAVARIGDLDRKVVRTTAEKCFSTERMAADHEALYERLIASRRVGPRSAAAAASAALAAAPNLGTTTAPPAGLRPSARPATPAANVPAAASATSAAAVMWEPFGSRGSALAEAPPVVTPLDPARRGRLLGRRRRGGGGDPGPTG